MGIIQASDKQTIPVKIIDACFTHVEVNGDRKLICELTGEDKDGNTGRATLWMDQDICTVGRDQDIGNKNYENAVARLTELGLPDRNIRKITAIYDADNVVFSCKEKVNKKTGDKYIQFYVQTARATIPLDDAAAELEAMLGESAAKEELPLEAF